MSETRKLATIPVGSLILVESGHHDEYSVKGPFRALEDLDVTALQEHWLLSHPEQRKRLAFRDCDFLKWVVSQGVIERVSAYTWGLHMSYTAHEMDVRPGSVDD